MHPTTHQAHINALLTSLSDRLPDLVHSLAASALDPSQTLADIETLVLRLSKDFASHLLAGLLALLIPADPPRSIPCSCGASACFQRIRSASVLTTLGSISIPRAYYLCPSCHHGSAPLDDERAFCAGSRSLALDELLALLGATQDSFAQAATVLERLTMLHLSPTTILDATETLGATLLAQQSDHAALLQAGHDIPTTPRPSRACSEPPSRLYISMDGVLAHLHERGWSEFKVGACYQTHTRRSRTHPEHHEIHAHRVSYITALCDAETFGWQLWQEAARRGVEEAGEVVVVADGAHWIWNIAEMHFPQATQIVDWYHASSYIWNAAKGLWGSDQEAQQWARAQERALWEGRVEEVLTELGQKTNGGEAVEAARSYYTTHKERMKYGEYRARGLQIGSGTIESGCKQVVSARLKGAGMIWSVEGGERVAVVRAWQRSERWEEAMRTRKGKKRGYVRKTNQECGRLKPEAEMQTEMEQEPASGEGGRSGLSAEVMASLRAELSQPRDGHPWRKAWSVKQQCREALRKTA